MIIFGIDPGLATTGYGIIKTKIKSQKIELVDFGCIITKPGFSDDKRLGKIYKELKKIVKKHKPAKIVVEELFFAKNVKTALKVGEARGVILLAARELKVPVFEFTPLEVKLAITGYGRASKQQVQKMIKALLGLKEIPRPDDVADALAVAICCANTLIYS